MEKEKNAFSCIVSVTAKDALRTLYDTRTEEAKILGGEKAATLGGVGGIEDLDGLLHSMREWTGPKVWEIDRKRRKGQTARGKKKQETCSTALYIQYSFMFSGAMRSVA